MKIITEGRRRAEVLAMPSLLYVLLVVLVILVILALIGVL